MAAPDAPELAAGVVRILAPLRGDAAALRRELAACGLAACEHEDGAALAEALRGRGLEETLFALFTHEGADEVAGAALLSALESQPHWARLPCLFLVADAARLPPACRMLDRGDDASPFIVIERPAKPETLRRTFDALAATRARQRRTRELMARLEESERRRSFLLGELRHRIGNSLGVLQGLFTLTARRASDVDALVESFSERLQSFAAAHAALSRENGGERSLGALIREQAEPHCLRPAQLDIDGPEARLDQDAAFDLALVISELATNAAKYGALSVEGGRVEARWRRETDGGLALRWTERNGPTVSPPTREGLGSVVIASFGEPGDGPGLRFEPEGVVWTARVAAGRVVQD